MTAFDKKVNQIAARQKAAELDALDIFSEIYSIPA